MSANFTKGIGISTYNRGKNIAEVIEAILLTKPNNAKVIIADDGSTDNTAEIIRKGFPSLTYIRGENVGVGGNKNRLMHSLRNYDFIAILEDDLVPIENGWFETYMKFCLNTNIHHLCRVQDRFVEETVPDFAIWCKKELGMTPIYGPTPRGDMAFITHMVLRKVGAFHPKFIGCGHAHGNWSDRIAASGLIGHPNKWIDIKEASVKFKQLGDTEGGRWADPKKEIQKQITKNAKLRKQLGSDSLYLDTVLP